jgi:hypothetical protein
MKRTIVLLVAMIFTLSGLSAGPRFSLGLAANLQWPADSGYKEVYGQSVFLPELKAGYSLTPSIYLWAGYGRVAAKGKTSVLQLDSKSSQDYLQLGAGYEGVLSGKLGFKAELGLADILYREEALGQKVSGSAIGFVLSGSLTYALGLRFYLLADLGYLYAQKTINAVDVKMGGLRAGLGGGLRF